MRKICVSLFASLLLFAFGCKDPQKTLVHCDEIAVAACSSDPAKPNLRIRNVSEYAYCNVQSNICCGEINFGSLLPAETTCYHAFDQLWSTHGARLLIDDTAFDTQVIDHVGDSLLPPGNYTLEIQIIDFANQRMQLTLLQD